MLLFKIKRHYATIGKGNGLLYVIMLCDRGINVNAVNKHGDTCLNLCVKNGAKENVRILQKLLFDFNADPSIFNNDNENFYSLMSKEAHKEKMNLEELSLTEELNNLFLNSNNSCEYNDNQDLKANANHKVEGKANQSNKLSHNIFYYFISVIIVIISNLVINYK